MKLVILGAAGKTGTHLVKQALESGHVVTGFVRESHQPAVDSPNLKYVVGDARNIDDLTKALKGQEAVISALGSNKPGDDLILQSTKALIEAMHQTGVRRVIMMSSFLASPNLKPPTGLAKLIRWLSRPLVRDKTSGENILKQSDLDWTIVYATRLDGAKPGSYRLLGPNETVSVNEAIARSDVAEHLIKQLKKPNSVRTAQVITSN